MHWTLAELRQLIGSWNLIPGSPQDEFDLLVSRLMKLLQRDARIDEIERVLESELVITYGLSPEPADIESMAKEVYAWWCDRKQVL